MKILVSSLFLLFLSGTYGAYIPPGFEVPEQPALRDTVKSVLYHSYVLGAELVSNWESSEAEREAVLSKRAEIIKTSYYSLAYGLVEYLTDICKEVDKEINETYPVYRSKVLPILASFFINALGKVHTVVEEIKPSFEKFEEHVKTQQFALWEEVRPIVESKAKPIIEAVNAHLKPYIDDVRKEVANANNKETGKSPSEQETTIPNLEENIKLAEFLQKIAMFDIEVLKKMVSQLEIFSTKAD